VSSGWSGQPDAFGVTWVLDLGVPWDASASASAGDSAS
jgi:hypothetical protein